MSTASHQLGFPRRVVGFYLLFCLAAITLLTAGAALAVQSLLQSQATGSALSRVGRLAAAIQLDHVNHGGETTPTLLREAQQVGRLAYAATVGLDGRYTAHTDEALVGSVAVDPMGSPLSWGAVVGTRFVDPDGRFLNEYAAELHAANEPIGALRVAVVEPDWTSTLVEFARHGALAVAGPLACLGLGGYLLRRIALPLAAVDQQLATLARLPRDTQPTPTTVPPHGLAAIGWNRVAEHVADLQSRAACGDPELKLRSVAAATEDRRTLAAIESISEGIALTDAEGRIEFANRAVEALLGSENPLQGADFAAALAALSPPCGEGIARGAAGARVLVDAPVVTGGLERTLRVERSPLRTSGPGAAGHVWTVRDVTQQKLAEASRDRFIETATHELRTPLANIKAYAETLASSDFSDAELQKEFLNTINSEATRLARFVDDLLSISSIEVGALALKRQNVDVRRLFEEAVEKVRPLMVAGSLRLEVKFAEKLGEAPLDKDKVAALLVNLLGNAAKYTPSGGVVTFTAVRKEDALAVEVRDTGVGIAEDEQERVFEKFFRSANPAVTDKVGTGLGLPLAREIARLHRGDVTLKSRLGEGSLFTVTLPLS